MKIKDTGELEVDIVTLTDAINQLKEADKSELYVQLMKTSRGKLLIPISFAPLLVGPQSLGKLYENPSRDILKSKVLLPAENIAIAATTLVHTTPFSTEGYKHLFVTKTNPVWVTNPTGLTISDIAFTLDNTTFYTIHEQTGSSVIYTLETTDGTTEAFFIDVAAAYVLAPLPSHDPGMKLRLSFTPAGAAESKNIEITVYGVS